MTMAESSTEGLNEGRRKQWVEEKLKEEGL